MGLVLFFCLKKIIKGRKIDLFLNFKGRNRRLKRFPAKAGESKA